MRESVCPARIEEQIPMICSAILVILSWCALSQAQGAGNPSVPVVGSDFQMTVEINVSGLNESLAVRAKFVGDGILTAILHA
jgi:hypothetical protein